jgi:uncharacterized damage-inducible protein DinB
MSPFLSSVQQVLLRDLDKLESEIRAYSDPGRLWAVEGQTSNSAGTLCLHLCGNLQHYFGAVLGGTGYTRDRKAEFSRRNVPVAELVAQIEAARCAMELTFPRLDDQRLDEDYPERVFERPVSTRFFLIHLVAHLGYHLGQVNYHRRLTDTPVAGPR